MRAITQVAVWLTLGERRVGEQGGGDRLQGQGHAEFLDHVGFVFEIKVGLHGAGAGHHVESEGTDLRHVFAHDLVAAFRHPGHVGARPFRLEAHAEKTNAELIADRLHFRQMLVGFPASQMDVFQLGTRQLELSGRLQGNRGIITQQGDDVAALLDRLPAEAGQSLEQGADAVFTLVDRRAQVIKPESEFFVFGADPPILRRTRARGMKGDELIFAGNQRGIVISHVRFLRWDPPLASR